MASVRTTRGVFELCECGNPDGHVGPVWHPERKEHPSGAKLKGKQSPVALELMARARKEKG